MTKISGNKFVALCESNVSEITVNQSVSQDEILSDRDDLGEEEGSILPEYGEGNDAKGKEEMKEVCEDKSNTGVDKTNEESFLVFPNELVRTRIHTQAQTQTRLWYSKNSF